MTAALPDALRALNGLRYLAALWVVVYHYGRNAFPFTQKPLLTYLEQGYMAVSFFFLLSGFVLAQVYVTRWPARPDAPALTDYARARFARIYPLYAVALLLAIWVEKRYGAPFDQERIATYLGESIGTFALIQAWTPGRCLSVNGPAWSLSAEAFLYLVFPVCLFALRGRRRRTLCFAAGAAWLCGLLFNLVWMVHWFPGYSLLVRDVRLYLPLLHLSTFVVGVAVGLLYADGLRPRWSPRTAAGLVLCCLLSPFLFERGFHWLLLAGARHFDVAVNWGQLAHNGALTPLWLLLILATTTPNHGWHRLAASPLAQAGGRLSYALYLLQLPVWLAVNAECDSLRAFPTAMFVVYLIVLHLLAWVAYRYLETPCRARLLAGAKTNRRRHPVGHSA